MAEAAGLKRGDHRLAGRVDPDQVGLHHPSESLVDQGHGAMIQNSRGPAAPQG